MRYAKIAIVSLISCGSVSAGSKQTKVTANIKDGHFDDMTGLDPSISWSLMEKAAGCDIEMGVDVAVKPTTDFKSLPRSIWGKVTRNVEGWNLSARANVEVENLEDIGFNICASNDDTNASLKLQASPGGFESIDVAKGFEALDGDLLVNPRYDAKSSIFDVVLGYSKEKTAIKLEASTSEQTLTVSRQVSDSDKLSPSVSSSGDLSLAWEKMLSGGDTVTTTLKTNDSVDIKWEDGAWVAQISTPVDGFGLGEGVDVSIKRKVDFM